jgi:Arc/MetJ-type ribon-helix-helix transcriptional regulator
MYPSANEVIRASIRLMQDQDELNRIRLDALHTEIAKGEASFERGEYTTISSAEEIEAFAEKSQPTLICLFDDSRAFDFPPVDGFIENAQSFFKTLNIGLHFLCIFSIEPDCNNWKFALSVR